MPGNRHPAPGGSLATMRGSRASLACRKRAVDRASALESPGLIRMTGLPWRAASRQKRRIDLE